MINFFLMGKLIQGGVKVRHVKDKYLHMKAGIFDNESITLGSFNLDKWSWCNNTELNFYCENPFYTHQLLDYYTILREESIDVEEPTTVDLLLQVKISFWTWFMNATNFMMNYRRLYQTDARNDALNNFWRDNVMKPLSSGQMIQEIPEDILHPYRRIFFDWDDVIGSE